MPFTCDASSGRIRRFMFLWYLDTSAALYRRGGLLAASWRHIWPAYAGSLEGPRASGVIRPGPFMIRPAPWECHFLAFFSAFGLSKKSGQINENSKVAKVARPKVAGPRKVEGPKVV